MSVKDKYDIALDQGRAYAKRVQSAIAELMFCSEDDCDGIVTAAALKICRACESVSVEDIDSCIDEQAAVCIRRLRDMDPDGDTETRNEAIEKILGKKEEIRTQLAEAKMRLSDDYISPVCGSHGNAGTFPGFCGKISAGTNRGHDQISEEHWRYSVSTDNNCTLLRQGAFLDSQKSIVKDEYYSDLILSVGPDCRPARNLVINHLREFSSPLDWMTGYSLDTVIHLFRDKFSDFFAEHEIDRAEPEGRRGMLRVNDTANQIVSIHHFPENMGLESSYLKFAEKMRMRAERLESRLQSASALVLIASRTDTREDMTAFLRSFSAVYPHLSIRLINMRHDEKMPFDSCRQETVYDDGGLSYIEYTLNDTGWGVRNLSGNYHLWSSILARYNTPASDAIRGRWLRFINNSKQLVIYGAGFQCHYILSWFSAARITVDGIAVSSMTDNPEEYRGVKVRVYSYYPRDASIIVSVKDKKEAKKIKELLIGNGYRNIAFADANLDLITATGDM